MAHISRKVKAGILTRLLAAAQQAPQGGESRCFVQFQSGGHIGVIYAHELIHHFAIGRHGIPAEGDFSVLGGGEGDRGFHMVRIFEIFEAFTVSRFRIERLVVYKCENRVTKMRITCQRDGGG